MKTIILEPDEKVEVRYHSSIAQHKNKLSVVQHNEFVPIAYDAIDAITCEGIISHREIVTDGDDIGYNFKVNECKFVSTDYLTYDDYGTHIKQLPEWFGKGTYKEFANDRSYLNDDNGALGNAQVTTLRVGINYALADKMLKADD